MTSIEEIEARLAATTPGPWAARQDFIDGGCPDNSMTINGSGGHGDYIASVALSYKVQDANTAFIANAPADVAYLLGLLQEQAETLAKVAELHKPETRWMPYEGAGISFDTREEALEAAEDADLGICATVPATFEVCAHCKRIEDSPCEGQCTLEAGYRESLWPCPTAAAAAAAANGDKG